MGLLTGYFSLVGYEDGIGYEEIYRLTSSSTTPSTPSSSNTNGAVPSGWYSTPQSVSRSYPYQWVSKRSKVDGNWGVWSTPVEYNRFVEDAKTYEYCYKATQYNSTPSTPTSSNVDGSVPSEWTSTIPSISAINAYVWESQRKKTNGSWGAWSTPNLKNRWSYDGADGAQGSKGAKMRIRTWEIGQKYLQGAEGEEFYDIVVYGTQLSLCIKSHTATASNAPNVSTTNWESAQQWTFIATQLLIAGKLVTDKITADLIDADGITAKNADISGKITATSGKIGGWTISGNNLVCSGSNTSINIEATGGRFMRINDSEEMMCSIRADGNTALRLSTYGTNDNSKCLVALCNADGYGTAIEAYGNIILNARPGEDVSIKGLRLNIRSVSHSQDINSNDDYLLCSGDITIKFPTPQSSEGKVYHIRRLSGTVTLTSYYISGGVIKPFILADGRNDYSTDIVTNQLHTYISNGIAWYEFK